MNRKLMAYIFVAIFLAIASFYVLKISNEFQGIIFLFPPLMATVLGVYAAKTYSFKNVHGRSMALLAAGMGCFFIGELIFFLFQYVFHKNPFPSIADIFYLTAYPLLLLGFINEIRLHKEKMKEFSPSFLSIAVPIILALTFIVSYFGIYKVYAMDASFLSNFISMSYGIADLIILIPAMFVLKLATGFRGGKLFYSWMIVFYAILFMLAGDILFALYPEKYSNGIWPYTLIDLLWTASYLLFGFSFYYTASVLKELRGKIKIKAGKAH